MWDLIVSVPDHCLSFYFGTGLFHLVPANITNWKCIFPRSVNKIRGAYMYTRPVRNKPKKKKKKNRQCHFCIMI